MKVAVVRGAFAGPWELQNFYPLKQMGVSLQVFLSRHPLDDRFALPKRHLWSPLDLPAFPYKMPILNRLLGDAHYLWGLEKELRGFDIAHTAETYYYYTQQCLEAKRRGWVKRVISTVWETIPFNNEGIWRRKNFKRRAYREVDLFLAPSRRAARALEKEGVAVAKIRVLPMGVGLEFFHSPKQKQAKSRLHLLFVGRLVKEKGVWDLLLSFQHLRQNGMPLWLWLIGQGPEKAKINRWLQANHLQPFVKIKRVSYQQMPAILQQADIFILPSRHTQSWEEQYGMAVVEALASGLPVIVSNSGALPEVVGRAGLVIPEGDISSLQKAIRVLAESPQKRYQLAQKAHRRAQHFYQASQVASKLLKIYQEVLYA